MISDIDKLSVSQLRKRCKDNNISGYSKLKKKDLVRLVKLCELDKMISSGVHIFMKMS